ncbi:MAG: hypothetical protein JXB39_07020 [Deltaproteobacteria bacterium]|nr:hypothetical protein [Deltaproteobacteria bacterium]
MNRTLLPLVLLSACDRSGDYLVPVETDVLPVLELGELYVLTPEEWEDRSTRESLVTYAEVGAPSPGERGGATFTFLGVDAKVCVVVDPEAVFWNQSVALQGQLESYAWPDNYLDDGDLDMSIGLSANYTGSPGIELGDFEGLYTDSLGHSATIEYDLCEMVGYYSQTPAHAGRATVESCEIDTRGRAGIEYTVVLRTFSLPMDDSILSFATAVYEGACANIDECTLPREAKKPLDPDYDFAGLEQAYCANEMSAYCHDNPYMCGDP